MLQKFGVKVEWPALALSHRGRIAPVHARRAKPGRVRSESAPTEAFPYAMSGGAKRLVLERTLAGASPALQRGTIFTLASFSCASTSDGTSLLPKPSAQASTSDWCVASPMTVGTPRLSAMWV